MVKYLFKKLLCIVLALCIALILCSCGENSKSSSKFSSSPVVHIPNEGDDSLNGYRKKVESDTNTSSEESSIISSNTISSSGRFCANTNSKVYHYTTCTFASKISSENYYSSDSREDMINRGYRACKKCNADIDVKEQSEESVSTQVSSISEESSSSSVSQSVDTTTSSVAESEITRQITTTQSNENISASYCANTNTKVFHYTSCSYASKIAEKNYYESNSREEMEILGYRPCKRCNP